MLGCVWRTRPSSARRHQVWECRISGLHYPASVMSIIMESTTCGYMMVRPWLSAAPFTLAPSRIAAITFLSGRRRSVERVVTISRASCTPVRLWRGRESAQGTAWFQTPGWWSGWGRPKPHLVVCSHRRSWTQTQLPLFLRQFFPFQFPARMEHTAQGELSLSNGSCYSRSAVEEASPLRGEHLLGGR